MDAELEPVGAGDVDLVDDVAQVHADATSSFGDAWCFAAVEGMYVAEVFELTEDGVRDPPALRIRR